MPVKPPTSQAQLTPSQLNASEVAQWKQFVRQELADTRCSIPAFLTSDMDVVNQTVSAQIAIQERGRTKDGPKWMSITPVLQVPIIVPRGGGYSITLPLKAGDEGLLIFCDCCFDLWWQHGGVQQQVGQHRHEFWDCGFLPGMWSKPNLLTNYSATSMQLRADDGSALLDVSTGSVKVQASGGTPLPLVNDNFYQWFVAVYMPSVRYVGTAPAPPANPETTILKGQ